MSIKRRLLELEKAHPKHTAPARKIEIVASLLAISEDAVLAGTSIREAETVTSYGLSLAQAMTARDEYANSHDNLIMLVEPCNECDAAPVSEETKSMTDAELCEVIFDGVASKGLR